jgi:hypothetical protein
MHYDKKAEIFWGQLSNLIRGGGVPHFTEMNGF